MKRTYIEPTIKVMSIETTNIICTSDMSGIGGDSGIDYGGGWDGSGLIRYMDMDEDDDW